MHRCHNSPLLILSYGSIGLLLLLLVGLLLPACSKEASASVLNTSATTDVNTTVIPSISIALGSKVDLIVDQFDEIITSSSPLTVTTNSREGYSLYLSTTGEDNSLHGQNKDNEAVISPIAKDTTASSFASNSWGYRLNKASEDNLYQPVPATADLAADTTTVGNTTTEYNLTFATKIDASLPTDTYYNSVVVSAVANPVAVTSLNELLYMQDMTPAICSNTMDYVDKEHYIEKQVIDIRDGKSYWVAKLADGNCWMVQNLGLVFKNSSQGIIAATADGGDGTKLTSENTDITTASWAPAEPSKTAGNASGTQAIAWDLNPTGIGSQQYYTWSAATAGTGTNQSADQIMPSSICPKGWKLPLAGVLTNDISTGPYDKGTFDNTNGSFQYLFTAHKLSTSSGQTLFEPPFNFVKAGYIDTGGALQLVGTGSNLWSSVSAKISWDPSAYAWSLNNNGYIWTSYFIDRTDGLSVRCLAR